MSTLGSGSRLLLTGSSWSSQTLRMATCPEGLSSVPAEVMHTHSPLGTPACPGTQGQTRRAVTVLLQGLCASADPAGRQKASGQMTQGPFNRSGVRCTVEGPRGFSNVGSKGTGGDHSHPKAS